MTLLTASSLPNSNTLNSAPKNPLFDGLFAKANPESICAQLPDERLYRYQDLYAYSGKMAQSLTALGVQTGDRIAVQTDKSIAVVALYLACLRIGAVFLPLNTAYTPHEIEYFLADSEAALFVCTPDQYELYQPIAKKHNCLLQSLAEDNGSLFEYAAKQSPEFQTIARNHDDLAVILYTSGTTGRAKGAMLTHHNLLSNGQTLAELWRFISEDRLLHALPIFHAHGLFVALNVCLLAGASMRFLPQFSVQEVLKYLPEATVFMGVPTFYTRLLAHKALTRENLPKMRLFTSGSAPLLAQTHQQFEQRTGHRILERYGMTETGMNTSNPYEGARKAGSIGLPLPQISLRICDPQSGEPVQQGEIGQLEVKGNNVFKGYWNMPKKTQEEHREDGYFITGDLAKQDADGYFYLVGRQKDLIISGGYNVYPKEIETVLDQQPEVLESAVIGVPHPDFGEAVIGILEIDSDTDLKNLDLEAIMQAIGKTLASYKRPKKLFITSELPRNTMGKVQKNHLRERYSALFQPV